MTKLQQQISEILYWCWNPMGLIKTHSHRKQYDIYIDIILLFIKAIHEES